MKPLTASVITGVLALGLSACGGGDGPGQTVTQFHEALQNGNFDTFCDTLNPELVSSLEESAGGQSCATTMERNKDSLFGDIAPDDTIAIIEVDEQDESATVTFTIGDQPEQQMTLVEIDGEWKVNVL